MKIIRVAVYFSGIFICLGLAVKKDGLIVVGVVPLLLLVISWFWEYTQKMRTYD